MKKISFYIFFFLFVVSVNVALAQTDILSESAKELKSKVEDGNYDAILEAGNSDDKSLIPYLKSMTLNSKDKWNEASRAFKAQIALAKLGDQDAFNEILAETDAPEPYVQDSALKKLSLVGGNKSFKKLYSLLDDFSDRKGEAIDVIYFPRGSLAITLLSQMVSDPPTNPKRYGMQEDVKLWKAWFEKHKQLLD